MKRCLAIKSWVLTLLTAALLVGTAQAKKNDATTLCNASVGIGHFLNLN